MIVLRCVRTSTSMAVAGVCLVDGLRPPDFAGDLTHGQVIEVLVEPAEPSRAAVPPRGRGVLV
ncbi:hypothetical protein [Streptomyces sp. NBC_00696]|uniref:hypothetical protein n=1 Tax=Streptomyces sp. NBC_00696 TaxID=2903672 RepID=UPI002E3458EF|nr:hypothetical protein [Streptomyces sp. NBC_00696]